MADPTKDGKKTSEWVAVLGTVLGLASFFAIVTRRLLKGGYR